MGAKSKDSNMEQSRTNHFEKEEIKLKQYSPPRSKPLRFRWQLATLKYLNWEVKYPKPSSFIFEIIPNCLSFLESLTK